MKRLRCRGSRFWFCRWRGNYYLFNELSWNYGVHNKKLFAVNKLTESIERMFFIEASNFLTKRWE